MTNIPLFPSDFDDGSFSKVAKFMAKHWPSSLGSLTLSQSQNILSEILGYKDFHDARKSASAVANAHHWEDDFLAILSRALQSYCAKGNPEELDDEEFVSFYDFTDSVPFRHLRFFKEEIPAVKVPPSAESLIRKAYKLHITRDRNSSRDSTYSLPKCVSYAISKIDLSKANIDSTSIFELLKATALPGGENALDEVLGNIHNKNLADAISVCSSPVSETSLHSINDYGGLRSELFCEQIKTGSLYEAISNSMLTYLKESILSMKPSSIFNAGFKRSKIEFSNHSWGMEHPYEFLGDRYTPEERYGDEIDEELIKDMQPSYDKAKRAYEYCHKKEHQKGVIEFGIYYNDPDGIESYDFYDWVCKISSHDGTIQSLSTGIVFSANRKTGLTAWDMMELADTDSGQDCDNVSWTLGEYKKTLAGKYSNMDLAEIPISKLTKSSPLVIVQSLSRIFNESSAPGDGVECLHQALDCLRSFFKVPSVSLSIMISPEQYVNNRMAPGFVKEDKAKSSLKLIGYFKYRMEPFLSSNLDNLFLPIGYSDLSD